tara:strand:- start:128 stop:331 length:204 start_codon:yes stop_codon:yes gene_type:complete
MKARVPTNLLSPHLVHRNKAVIKAVFIGLPLYSYGMIPVAIELQRSGASAAATSAFVSRHLLQQNLL